MPLSFSLEAAITAKYILIVLEGYKLGDAPRLLQLLHLCCRRYSCRCRWHYDLG